MQCSVFHSSCSLPHSIYTNIFAHTNIYKNNHIHQIKVKPFIYNSVQQIKQSFPYNITILFGCERDLDIEKDTEPK